MRIVELILADDEMTGIEAISVVENPAIEEDLLVPNKPIYRRKGEEEYYIYFSRETVERASQLYLMNGNQSKATLEHQHTINGLTLVESWLVEDEVHDKSRKYGLNVPVGTWMGAVKVNNDQIWNDFVKTGKVKGFSIEGYFADKMERPKEPINDLEMKAEEQLSTIREIITEGERVELNAAEDATQKMFKAIEKIYSNGETLVDEIENNKKRVQKQIKSIEQAFQKAQKIYVNTDKDLSKAAKELGIAPAKIPNFDKFMRSYFFIERKKDEIIALLKKYI
mgnify:FL=1